MQPLEPRMRRLALLVAAVCGLAVVALAVRVHRFPDPLPLDARGRRAVLAHPFGFPIMSVHVAVDFQKLGRPVIFAILVGGVVTIALILRDWLGAAVSGAGPTLALLLTERVGKPLVGRREPFADGFPSGHATAMAALGATILVLAYRQWGWKGALLSLPLALGLPTGMAVAVVRTQAHLFTDAVAGVLVGAGVVFGLASLASEGIAVLRPARVRA